MNQRSLLSGTFAAAAVALALACSGGPTVEAQSNGGLTALLPPDARAVFGIDAATARGSELYRRFEEKLRADKGDDLEDWIHQTGFDPRTDLDRFVAAVWPRPDEGDGFLAVAEGSFARARASEGFAEHIEQIGAHRGVTLYAGHERGEDRKVFAFLDDRTAVLGDHAGVVGAIDRRLMGGPSLRDNAELAARADAAAAGGQLWLVSQQPGEIVDAPGALERRPELLTILQNMRSLDLVADVRSGLRLDLEGACQSADDASTLADAARGLLALTRLGRSEENRAFYEVLDGVSIRETGATIEAGLNVSSIQLQELIDQFEASERAGF